MFRNKEESPGTSESSHTGRDVYNIHCNYTEQLNMVRRRFNLTEFQDDEYEGCKITEISDESGISSRNISRVDEPFAKKLVSSAAAKQKGYDLSTIHPFSLNYNLESGSSTNIFESDYSPPSKKVCQRLKTPRFTSISEGSVSYHTKVGIHDSLFKGANDSQRKENVVLKTGAKYFTETRDTQCTEKEFMEEIVGPQDETESKVWNVKEKISRLNLTYDATSECDSPTSGPLFPKVIIDTNRTQTEEESTISSPNGKMQTTSSSANKESVRRSSKRNVLPLNSVRGSSDEEDECAVSVTSTTVDIPGTKKSKTNPIKNPKGPLEGMTMWEEVARLRSGTDDIMKVEHSGGGDSAKSGDLNDFSKINAYVTQLSHNIKLGECLNAEHEKNTHGEGKSNLKQYVKQYIQYKTEVEKVRVASAKKHSKHTVIGQRVVNMENRIVDSPEKLYQSENSLVSDEDGCTKSATRNSCDSRTKRSFWERFCLCFCPKRTIGDQ